ncbi:MAG TPA: flagellar hook-associated protein FlgK [Candidatus Limnocylindrales bacterium]
MTSAWFGLNTALSALRAAQTQLDVSAHNTANANTPGYSRQRVELIAGEPYSYPAFNRSGLPGQIGTGVTVAQIQRVRDAFLDGQLREQLGLQGQWQTRSDELAKVETILPEPASSGLGSALSTFWNAWQDVATDPSSTAARTALLEQAATLAQRFGSAAGQLKSLIGGQDYQVGQQVASVNDLAARIASLNAQIQRVAVTGDQPNDLADQRDQLLAQLSTILPVDVQPQADGTVNVLVGGTDLVSGLRARAVTTAPDAVGHAVPTWSSGGAVELGDGRLAQYVALRDTVLPGYLAQLNTLAKGIADAVNGLHQSGVDESGAAGLAFFTYATGDEAASLAVNAAVAADPTKVAAATAANQPGDGGQAGAIADLRSALLFGSGTQSATDFYAGLVGRVGSDTRQAADMATNQGLVVDHLQQLQQSTSGVSLDEEAADMIRFQHAYQAAARVITAMDEMLDQLVNRTGLVGR